MIKSSELKPLLDLCREKGVQAFKCPEFEFVLGPAPFIADPTATSPAKKRHGATPDAEDDPLERALFQTGQPE